ncbi:hypothetical protein KSS87_003912, partial [Heliosperma pusillum]
IIYLGAATSSNEKKIFNELRWLDLAGCHHCQLCEYVSSLSKHFVQVQPHLQTKKKSSTNYVGLILQVVTIVNFASTSAV